LINPAWLGAYAIVDENRVVNTGMDVEYLLDNGVSRAKVHAGIGNINNNPERVFILDNDFIHINTIRIEDTAEILEYLHTNAKAFIRRAITDALHEAMEPEPIE
jgi:sulfur transfer complex TusBCD TusB component (DsrH family)